MKTKIYSEVQEKRELAKNAHGTFANSIKEWFQKNRGYRLEGYETPPVKPNPKDLRRGIKHDVLMRTKGKKHVALEVIEHILADRSEASKQRERAITTGCKPILVPVLEYTQGFVDYCVKHKIEAFVPVSRSKMGHLKLKKIA